MDEKQSTYLHHTPVKSSSTPAAYKDQRAKDISGIGSAGGYLEAGAKTITPVSPTPGMEAHRSYSSSLPPTIRIDLPPRFSVDGGEDFHQWCRQLEVAVNAGAGESVALVQLLPSRLSGSAFLPWDSQPNETRSDFTLVKRKLSDIFWKKDEVSSFRSVLTAHPRLSREPLEVY